ncbi:MAG: hypothetical protein ABR985_11435 [Methanotrichaceae archaeon]|jgi:tetratricopeptide (TPR) repeat protein
MARLLVLAALCAVLMVACISGNAVEISPEQRIISYEINKSAGNMTGDDYVIALIYATLEGYRNNSCSTCSQIEDEIKAKFPEYNVAAENAGVAAAMTMSSEEQIQNINIDKIEITQPIINKVIQSVFSSDYLSNARAAVQACFAEQAHQRELDIQREAIQQAAERKKAEQIEENKSNQLALDAHYKSLSENYTANVTALLNQSKFNDALNLSNDAITNLVSPYSNIMMISRGDIYTSMGRYAEAIGSFQSAQANFTYDNDSIDYQNEIQQDFERDWNTITNYKTNLATQKLNDQINAMKHDLRNAPDVKQLLSGHDGGRKYSVNVENDTYAGRGYAVRVNLSAINEPIDPTNQTDIDIKRTEDTKAFVPVCIDMFGGLFADKRISLVCIHNNETYLDRFGHKKESDEWWACMSNKTATRVGSWSDFKQYVGTDMTKLSSVASVEWKGDSLALSRAIAAGAITPEEA